MSPAAAEFRAPSNNEPISPIALSSHATWQVVLKVVGPCNLNCRNCYVYNMADDGWKEQPKEISPSVIMNLAGRLAAHHARQPETRFNVCLHGGEPLMLGAKKLSSLLGTLHTALPGGAVNFSMQTNGTLLTNRTIDVLQEYNVAVGISLDGTHAAHDRYRLYRNGDSSYERTVNGINRLRQEYPAGFSGLLAVIDLANDPKETYDALASFDPPVVDFLLPHGNWNAPPPGKENPDTKPYGLWLNEVFDAWRNETPPRRTDVRFFRSVIRLLQGLPSSFEALGLAPVREIVVQPNGDYQQVDTLESTYNRAAHLGLNVTDHEFSEAIHHPAIQARLLGGNALRQTLAPSCQHCGIVNVCGSGYLPHRYGTLQENEEDPFNNRSVYCRDLAEIIGHIAGCLQKESIINAADNAVRRAGRPGGRAYES